LGCGVPIDGALLRRLAGHWEAVKLDLIGELGGARFGYDDGGHFRPRLFADYLHRKGIA
jgi:hypothetical protein